MAIKIDKADELPTNSSEVKTMPTEVALYLLTMFDKGISGTSQDLRVSHVQLKDNKRYFEVKNYSKEKVIRLWTKLLAKYYFQNPLEVSFL